ncbi:glutathione-dependent reductase [Streptomyces minutiscleroticus]|uniref:Glutathione-dependent reductase n=1 Tax=Streptomyces minutiscleroticus TaxID=68238 RepID=A0A918NRQ1_9ACTN|nr:glutathione S-transferase C-terminal domain-containing protein [Streptomyces minutiscleroticus]GGX90479.1 glutathione-dependent reductase [Streptomyces minutiscleroticus]
MSVVPPIAAPAPSPSSPSSPSPFRGRIGGDARSGHYAVPRRYRLHLCLSCPDCLRIAVTHGLLGLADAVPVTLLPAVPDAPGGGHSALVPLYEAGAHRYSGPAAAPVLGDGWTGRVVSTHTPDILHDLARRFGCERPGRPDLYPRAAEAEIEAVALLCERGVDGAARRAGRAGAGAEEREEALATLFGALDALEARLAGSEWLAGEALTAADVQAWVSLVRLDTVHRLHLDAAAVHRIAGHPRLWAHARRLTAIPAFGAHLDLEGIVRRHRADCRDREAAGAAVRILDWAAHARREAVSSSA